MDIDCLLPKERRKTPKVYAYSDTSFPGQLKIGYTERDDVMERIREQHPIQAPSITYHLEWWKAALTNDGSSFTDKDLHRYLKKKGFVQTEGEWFKCSVDDVDAAWIAVKGGIDLDINRFLDFKMRPEQKEAVEMTCEYYRKCDRDKDSKVIPHFLWNAKMRFGKTFTTYQMAKAMGFKRILVITFKPAVEEAWRDDLMNHVDFDGWQFYESRSGDDPEKLDKSRPIVCFGSFQDYLGENDLGGIKSKNEWVHAINWDLIVLDEYHYGAWNENSKNLLDSDDKSSKDDVKEQNSILQEDGYETKYGLAFDEDVMPITGYHYLYLSGTPFRALKSGEFLEDQIFNWTYQDEQEAKAKYEGDDNPYAEMPMMVMLTYQMPDDLGYMIDQYDMNEFDLNEFFKAEGSGDKATFVHEEAVQKWLDIIRGKASIFNKSDSPYNQKPPLPFSDGRLLDVCNHTMWFMYSVASCDAMCNLFKRPANNFYQNYNIVNCSGTSAGIGVDALGPVREAMTDNPILSKTITLTCGKLTTGVTIKPLSGIFMLRNCSSPETYFQAAFRVQSPWSVKNEENPMVRDILKSTCYVFDFAPNRALREVVDYAEKLSVNRNAGPVDKVDEFTHFLPILQFDGSSMKSVDASEILDFVDNGTTANLLARRWKSATLVNVNDAVLERVLSNKAAYDAIMKIEGFRELGGDIFESIINKSKDVKDTKKRGKGGKKEKKKLTEKEKELKSKRKEVQEKLIKFATRIPIFMYLTDYREEALTDIIRKLEPSLFLKVTGLDISDFELLISVGVFNDSQMNDAILKFRRYEERSLSYCGIDRHRNDKYVGAWSGRLLKKDLTITAVE